MQKSHNPAQTEAPLSPKVLDAPAASCFVRSPLSAGDGVAVPLPAEGTMEALRAAVAQQFALDSASFRLLARDRELPEAGALEAAGVYADTVLTLLPALQAGRNPVHAVPARQAGTTFRNLNETQLHALLGNLPTGATITLEIASPDGTTQRLELPAGEAAQLLAGGQSALAQAVAGTPPPKRARVTPRAPAEGDQEIYKLLAAAADQSRAAAAARTNKNLENRTTERKLEALQARMAKRRRQREQRVDQALGRRTAPATAAAPTAAAAPVPATGFAGLRRGFLLPAKK